MGWVIRIVAAAALVMGVAGQVTTSMAEVRGDRELLRQVAEGYTANEGRIRTWVGEATLRFVEPVPGRKAEARITVQFAADIEHDAARWEFKEDAALRAIMGTGVAPAGMLKGGQFYEARTTGRGPGRLVTASAAAERQPDWRLDAFHPMRWVHEAGGERVAQWLWMNYDDAGKKSIGTAEIRRQGDLVTYELGDGKDVNRYVFDLSKGCSVVEFHSATDSLRVDWQLTVESAGGAFVPKTIDCTRTEVRGNNPTVSRRRVDFTRSVVNGPIPAGVFDLASLEMVGGLGGALLGPATAPAAEVVKANEVITRTYDLQDLISGGPGAGEALTLAKVQDLIVAGTEPESWGEEGPGSIRQVEGKTLVITHTRGAHEQVAQLLQEMREPRPLSVIVETKFIAVLPEKIPAELLDPATKRLAGGGYLDAKQAEELVQNAQSVIAVPRVVVRDGGTGQVRVATETNYVTAYKATTRPDGTKQYKPKTEAVWDGVKLDVTANVSKDRKHVRLRLQPVLQKVLKVEIAEFTPEGKDQQPIQVQMPMVQTIDVSTDVMVPNGKYLCLGGQVVDEEVEGKGKVESVLLVLVKAEIPTVGDGVGGSGK